MLPGLLSELRPQGTPAVNNPGSDLSVSVSSPVTAGTRGTQKPSAHHQGQEQIRFILGSSPEPCKTLNNERDPVKRQPEKGERMFANYRSKKGLVPTMYTEFIQINSKKKLIRNGQKK